jgi:hypothetical protein
VDGLVAVLRSALLEAETQPAVIRVDERADGARVRRALGFERRDLGAFARDAGDDGNAAADRVDPGFPRWIDAPFTLWVEFASCISSLRQPIRPNHGGCSG